MPTHRWNVEVEGEQHVVEVQRSSWSNAGEATVDGRVMEAWGLTWNLTEKRFDVGSKRALVRWPGVFAGGCDLFVDGLEIPRS